MTAAVASRRAGKALRAAGCGAPQWTTRSPRQTGTQSLVKVISNFTGIKTLRKQGVVLFVFLNKC